MVQSNLIKQLPPAVILFLTVIILCLFSYGILTTSAESVPAHPFFNDTTSENTTKTIAHRGGLGLWPENTLYAFQQAAAIGSDAIQIDLRISVDDTLIAIHDSTVERTTNGFGDVINLTVKELQNLDAGYKWSSDDNLTFKYRDQGITIPTIHEVFAETSNLQIYIDIKSEGLLAAKLLCMSIREHNMTQKVLVSAENDLTITQFRATCPEIATSASTNEQRVFTSLNAAFLTPIYSPRFNVLGIPPFWYGLRIITPNLVRSAHLRGLRVHAVNINEYNEMQLVIQQGIDGIITDYPNLLIDTIHNK